MRSLTRHPWITFTVLRLLLFIVPLVVATALGANLALAAIIAAVIALALSVILLPRLRTAMATDLAARTGKPRAPTSDEDAEDSAVDTANAPMDQAPVDQDRPNTSARPTP